MDAVLLTMILSGMTLEWVEAHPPANRSALMFAWAAHVGAVVLLCVALINAIGHAAAVFL